MEKLSPDDLLLALDAEQRQVAQSTSGPVCVLAGAGTGKTRAITYRIAYGIATGAFNPNQILAVTFTARAAAEMHQRLVSLGAPRVQARTFHSAALRQLRYFWPHAIGGSMPQILEHKVSLVSSCAKRLGLSSDKVSIRDFAAEIEWSKFSLISPSDYAAEIDKRKRPVPGDLSAEKMAKLISLYEESKHTAGVIDFEDVLLLTIGMIENRPDIAQRIREQYQHFVVDEYQDISQLGQRLLDGWLGGRQNLCVVGDPAQTIYSFAGASSNYLQNFTVKYPNAKKIVLNRDYRSTPQIVSVANTVVAGCGREVVKLRSQLPSDAAVAFESYADEAEQASQIAAQIKRLQAQGTSLSQIAILLRTNAQSASFEQALEQAKISYQLRGGEQFFQRQEVMRTVRAFVSTALGAEQVSAAELMKECASGNGWTQTVPAQGGALRDRWDALQSLVNLAQDRDAEGVSLRAVAQELQDRIEAKHPPALEAVTIATLHAAKGLEWEAVFLPSLVEGLIPFSLSKTSEQIAEENRLLYVGVTRAKRLLYMSYHRFREGTRGKQKRSRFLQKIWPAELDQPEKKSSASSKTRRKVAQKAFWDESDDATIARFEALKAWRTKVHLEIKKPAYTIFADDTLRHIAQLDPDSLTALGQARGVGNVKLDMWGEEVLAVLQNCR
ncbi:ATP-dependent DNA helicase UvrD2 [Boudabousia tangfeifanii]|uniref:ATP-dependent DNA helicase UvrD2 n=1 Tax=Boudabousia tangfeifanii TaxID=1912795 RepID=UPI000A54AFBD|nr:ATP-dependent DNA helicase UvrD2 [Boudabousia tangfeifanii]